MTWFRSLRSLFVILSIFMVLLSASGCGVTQSLFAPQTPTLIPTITPTPSLTPMPTPTFMPLTPIPPMPTATPTKPSAQEASGAEEAEIMDLVENFGKRLQAVWLQSPNVVQEIREQYSEFVSPSLLETWMSDLSKAPGRAFSSPWPDTEYSEQR